MHAWRIALVLTCAATNHGCAAPRGASGAAPDGARLDAMVRIEFAEPVTTEFLGIGVQWASYPWHDLSPEDWAKVFSLCETIGKTKWYIVEYEVPGVAPLTAVAKCIENLRKMGK